MTDAERNEIKAVVTEAVAAALANSTCQCGLSSDAHKEMGHLCGMIKDIGGDNMSRGVEVIRENEKYIKSLRSFKDKISWVVASGIVVGVVSFVGGLAWLGFKVKAGQP